jgi:hypothetical protein
MSETLVTQVIREAVSLVANPATWTECDPATTADGYSCEPCDPQATRLPVWRPDQGGLRDFE